MQARSCTRKAGGRTTCAQQRARESTYKLWRFCPLVLAGARHLTINPCQAWGVGRKVHHLIERSQMTRHHHRPKLDWRCEMVTYLREEVSLSIDAAVLMSSYMLSSDYIAREVRIEISDSQA